MKIQSVQNYNSKNNDASTQKSKFQINNHSSKPNFGVGGCYGGGGNPFGPGEATRLVYKWAPKKLRILDRTVSEMKDLAEYFHNQSNAELKAIAKEAYNDKSNIVKTATERLIEFVTPIRANKLKMVQRISELEIKKTLGISNATEQKIRLNREFISLIAAEKEGKEPPIKNGILVHGISRNKDSFIDWITDSTGAVVKTIQHKSGNPTRTIDTLIEIAENAERAFKHSRTRTIVVIKDLDKMLSNKKSTADMDNINEFKSIAEDLSKKYHTTIITSTDKHLDEFEPATIASNRLGVHVDLKDGISEDELRELDRLKAEVKSLDNKTAKASDKFKISDGFLDSLIDFFS